MTAVKTPAPQMRRIKCLFQIGKVVRRIVDLRHHMALQAVVHSVELRLHQVAQMRKAQHHAFHMTGQQLVQIKRQTRRLRPIVALHVGRGALEFLFLGAVGIFSPAGRLLAVADLLAVFVRGHATRSSSANRRFLPHYPSPSDSQIVRPTHKPHLLKAAGQSPNPCS